MKSSSPTIKVLNNLDEKVSVNLMNSAAARDGFINQRREFQFNMSCEGFTGTDKVRISAKLNNDAGYTVYTANLPLATPAGTVAALNTLGIGVFFLEEQGGVTYINVYSDSRMYTALQLFNNAGLSSNIDIDNFSVTNTTGGITLYKNCIMVVDLPNGGTFGTSNTADYGSLMKFVVTPGNLASMVWFIANPDGSIIAEGTANPGDPVQEAYFVADKPTPLGQPYVIVCTDNV